MKHLFIILAFLTSITVSAQTRVMTSEEKQALRVSPEFNYLCEWAVRDFADYWSTHDGSGFSTEAERITWAKNRQLGVAVKTSGITFQNAPATVFLEAAKGKLFTLGAAPQSDSTLIVQWKAENSFEEFANAYFKTWGDFINMSVGN